MIVSWFNTTDSGSISEAVSSSDVIDEVNDDDIATGTEPACDEDTDSEAVLSAGSDVQPLSSDPSATTTTITDDCSHAIAKEIVSDISDGYTGLTQLFQSVSVDHAEAVGDSPGVTSMDDGVYSADIILQSQATSTYTKDEIPTDSGNTSGDIDDISDSEEMENTPNESEGDAGGNKFDTPHGITDYGTQSNHESKVEELSSDMDVSLASTMAKACENMNDPSSECESLTDKSDSDTIHSNSDTDGSSDSHSCEDCGCTDSNDDHLGDCDLKNSAVHSETECDGNDLPCLGHHCAKNASLSNSDANLVNNNSEGSATESDSDSCSHDDSHCSAHSCNSDCDLLHSCDGNCDENTSDVSLKSENDAGSGDERKTKQTDSGICVENTLYSDSDRSENIHSDDGITESESDLCPHDERKSEETTSDGELSGSCSCSENAHNSDCDRSEESNGRMTESEDNSFSDDRGISESQETDSDSDSSGDGSCNCGERIHCSDDDDSDENNSDGSTTQSESDSCSDDECRNQQTGSDCDSHSSCGENAHSSDCDENDGSNGRMTDSDSDTCSCSSCCCSCDDMLQL